VDGELEELKGLALLVASPAASFITGAAVPIDGFAVASSYDQEASLGTYC
jgi:hypothetical protein